MVETLSIAVGQREETEGMRMQFATHKPLFHANGITFVLQEPPKIYTSSEGYVDTIWGYKINESKSILLKEKFKTR